MPFLSLLRTLFGAGAVSVILYITSATINQPVRFQDTGPAPEYHLISYAYSNWLTALAVVLFALLLIAALVQAVLFVDHWFYEAGECIIWGLLLLGVLVHFWRQFTGSTIAWIIAMLVAALIVAITCVVIHFFREFTKAPREKLTAWHQKLKDFGNHRSPGSTLSSV